MYYLCDAGVILHIAGELIKRVKAYKIGRFPVVSVMRAVRAQNIFSANEKCLLWSFLRADKSQEATLALTEHESRTRIARSSFSAKNHTNKHTKNQRDKFVTDLCSEMLTRFRKTLGMTGYMSEITAFNGNGGII